MAYQELPHQGRLWPYAADTDEWARRLERRYEQFVTDALEAGVDRRTVEANFEPESAVWTPVQLREEFGTVEWRSPDTALPGEVVRLADRLATVTARLRDADLTVEGRTGDLTGDRLVVPEFEAVLDYVNAAIREGLASDAVRSYLDRMGFDVAAYEPVTHEIDGRERVTPSKARRLRLEYARRLERAVMRTRSVNEP